LVNDAHGVAVNGRPQSWVCIVRKKLPLLLLTSFCHCEKLDDILQRFPQFHVPVGLSDDAKQSISETIALIWRGVICAAHVFGNAVNSHETPYCGGGQYAFSTLTGLKQTPLKSLTNAPPAEVFGKTPAMLCDRL
jgi:hypothetical protein